MGREDPAQLIVSNEWRRIVAALDNGYRRAVYSEVVLGIESEPSSKRDRAIAALRDAGLVDATGAAIPDIFARLLAEHPPVIRTGVDRWLRDGRIDSWPAKTEQRRELLEWAAVRIEPQRDLTEAEINEQLATVTKDVATLRRYLVDAELLDRSTDGSSYRRG